MKIVKMNTEFTVKSVFVVVSALLFIFMFWNREAYFNINNYKWLLIIAVMAGLLQLVAEFSKIKKIEL